jgi:hypothetical protein
LLKASPQDQEYLTYYMLVGIKNSSAKLPVAVDLELRDGLQVAGL